MDEGCTHDGSKGSTTMRPASISSRMVRSERITALNLVPSERYADLSLAGVVQRQNISFPS